MEKKLDSLDGVIRNMKDFVRELYKKYHTDQAILDYLCEKDNLTQEEEQLREQLLIEEEAVYGYSEDDD